MAGILESIIGTVIDTGTTIVEEVVSIPHPDTSEEDDEDEDEEK